MRFNMFHGWKWWYPSIPQTKNTWNPYMKQMFYMQKNNQFPSTDIIWFINNHRFQVKGRFCWVRSIDFSQRKMGIGCVLGGVKKRSHHDKETILYPYKLVHRRSCYYSFLSHVKCINANITATKLGDLPGMRFFGFLARFSDRSAPDDLQKK